MKLSLRTVARWLLRYLVLEFAATGALAIFEAWTLGSIPDAAIGVGFGDLALGLMVLATYRPWLFYPRPFVPAGARL